MNEQVEQSLVDDYVEVPDNQDTAEQSADSPDIAEDSGTLEALESEPRSDDSVDVEPQETEGEGKPKRSGVQKRIDELTRDKHSARREAEYWQQQAMQAQQGQQKQPAPEPVQAEPQAPTVDQFDDYDQYVGAVARYNAQMAMRDEQARLQEQQAEQQKQQQMAQIAQAYQQKESEVRAKHEDYDEVVRNPSLPINSVMAQVIQRSEAGPEIAYYLGNNPAVADQISRLSPLDAVKQLAVIETNLSKKPEAAPPRKPVDPVSTVGAGEPAKVDPEKLTMDQWLEWRNSNAKPRR